MEAIDPLVEHWTPIAHTFGRYEVSSLGRVRRIRKKTLKPVPTKWGYVRVALSGRLHSVHRLVAEAFIGPCPHGYQVNHKDSDRQNNCADNLEYVTPKENQAHSWKTGKRKGPHRGMTTHFAKLTDNDVIHIRRMRRVGYTYKQIAEHFNTKQANVWHICQGKTWKHLLPDQRMPPPV